MTQSQLTHIQIDNYGPWTVTPEPRREVDLQTLQSRLYADLSQLFGNRDADVFFTRFDNMIAVSNGVTMDDHALIQGSVANRYPVTMSRSVSTGETPAAALIAATNKLQEAGSAQDEHRREILAGTAVPPNRQSETDVHPAHFDVNGATEKYTDQLNEFDMFISIEQSYTELMRYMRETHGALSFFLGGDNIIAVCPSLDVDTYHSAIDHVAETVGVDLNVGVGRGPSATAAGMDAKHALEDCRATGTTVERGFE